MWHASNVNISQNTVKYVGDTYPMKYEVIVIPTSSLVFMYLYRLVAGFRWSDKIKYHCVILIK